MNIRPMQKIWIVGADIHGWSLAMALASQNRNFPIEVNVLEMGTPSQSRFLTCGGHLFDFHRRFQVAEREFMGSDKVAFFSAQRIEMTSGHSYWLGNDTSLPKYNGFELHHLRRWLSLSDATPLSLAALAAKEGHRIFPSKQSGTLGNSFELGAVIDSVAYTRFIKEQALALGVKSHDQCFRRALINDKNGCVSAIETTDGQRHSVDFIIDNTGRNGEIIDRELGMGWDSWGDYLPFTHFAETIYETPVKPRPYVNTTVHESGFSQTLTLPGVHVVQHHAFDSKAFSSLQNEQFTYANMQPVNPGKRHCALTKNCLAIGGAAGSIQCPLLPDLMITHRIAQRLADFLPSLPIPSAWRAEFNRQVEQDFDLLRDYYSLYLEVLGKYSAPAGSVWKQEFALQSDNLQAMKALFNGHARCNIEENQMIHRQRWLSLLDRLLDQRRSYDPLLDSIPKSAGTQYINQMQEQLANMVNRL